MRFKLLSMTSAEKRQARRTAVLGVMLTCLVIGLDGAGLLGWLDRPLYDARARICQFFAPPPTDDLVYIDIDDQSIDTIGNFPWPRQKMAAVVDEIHRAGAKVVWFDVVFSDRQEPQALTRPGENGQPEVEEVVDPDKVLADACRRAGRVLVPATFNLTRQPHGDTYGVVREVLEQNLELSPDDVVAKLRGNGITRADLDFRVRNDFPEAHKDAIYARIDREVPLGQPIDPQQLRGKLLPRTPPSITSSTLLTLFSNQCEKVQADRAFMRFGRRGDASLPHLISAPSVTPPISQISAAISMTGYVDYLPLSDGVVRTMPLLITYKGGVYPQAGMALACAMLDVDPANPAQLQISDSAITLHPPNHKAVSIPVRSQFSPRLSGTYDTFMNIPWYGAGDWADMYRRFGRDPHLLVNDIWQLALSRQALAVNARRADEAIRTLTEALRPDDLKKLQDHPMAPDDFDARSAAIDSLIKEMRSMPGYLEMYQGKRPEDFDKKDDKIMCQAVRGALDYLARTPDLKIMITGQEDFLRKRLQNRAAMIGYVATAAATSDVVPTSLYPRCPGVIIHGAIFNGIMTGELWRTMPRWVGYLVTFIVGLMATGAVAVHSPWKAVFATLALIAVYLLINGVVLFDYFNILIDPSAGGVIAAAGLVFAGCTATRLLIEGIERARITERFRAYSDPALVDEIVDNPALAQQITAGQERTITVVFADLAGSTALFEKVGAGIVSILNRYFSRMVPVIRQHKGYVNKFIGDGIMFFFNAPRLDPDHPLHAVSAVHDMHRALLSFNEELAAEGLPTIGMRAGIATDTVIVGDAGATDRSDYTALGDAVNLASRLEGANKFTGTRNLLTQATADALKDKFLLRPIGKLQVVGKENAVIVYEAVAPLDEATDEQKEMVALTREMVQTFGQACFAECIRITQELESRFGATKLTSLYRSLATLHQSTPPGEPFEGRIVLAEK